NLAVIASPISDSKCRPHRPLVIVLVRKRRTKERHHRVPNELLHRAAKTLKLGTQTLVIRAQDRLHVLRIELLGARSKSDQIGKPHRHYLALAVRLGHIASLRRQDSPSRPAAAVRTLLELCAAVGGTPGV